MGKLLTVVFFLVTALLLTWLKSYIVLSIANLYGLKLITQFTLAQMFGLIFIIDMLAVRYKKPKENSWDESIVESITAQLSLLVVYLMTWGITFIVYYWFLS